MQAKLGLPQGSDNTSDRPTRIKATPAASPWEAAPLTSGAPIPSEEPTEG